MGQHPELTLDLLGRAGPGSEERAEQSLVPGDGTLDLPPLVVDRPGEGPPQRPPVQGPRPPPAGVPRVEPEDGLRDAEVVPAQGVVVLGVVRGITQHPADPEEPGGLSDGGRELGRVLARAAAEHRPGQEVGRGVAGDRQLRPGQPGEPLVPGPPDVVAGGVPGVQPGRIDGDLGPGGGQAASAGVGEDGPLEGVEAPFLSSRAAAYARVE